MFHSSNIVALRRRFRTIGRGYRISRVSEFVARNSCRVRRRFFANIRISMESRSLEAAVGGGNLQALAETGDPSARILAFAGAPANRISVNIPRLLVGSENEFGAA